MWTRAEIRIRWRRRRTVKKKRGREACKNNCTLPNIIKFPNISETKKYYIEVLKQRGISLISDVFILIKLGMITY